MSDIFTRNISNSDLLWRVRAYVIGFLLADGTIRTYPYEISATQKEQDKEILSEIQKALGGKINGPDENNKYHLNVFNKELVLTLFDFGMVQAHSKEEIASTIYPPDFIQNRIFGQTLIRDFIRGFYDGDGWFTGSFSRGDTSFKIIGPFNFLNSLKQLVLIEVPGLTSFITNERKQYFIIGDQQYQLFSKFTIYQRSYGFYRLSPLDLEKGEIVTLDHPWLKILHFGGNLNAIRLFNWLYEDDDKFDKFDIQGIKICGKRKFEKALNELGNARFRSERLAPDWKDMLYDTILQMQPRFYKTHELIELSNTILWEKLELHDLINLYEMNKIHNRDKFVERLKFLEYLDNVIVSYRSGRENYYYSKVCSSIEIPPYLTKYIDLIDRNGIKQNLKNLIVLILIGNYMKFNDLLNEIRNKGIFHEHGLYSKNIKLSLAQLKSFDIVIVDDEEEKFENQSFFLNTSVLNKYYKMNILKLKKELTSLFYKI
ncbi:MAG: hypothetical protein ACFFDK_16915 [Promethearchaeota archaeon]